MNDETPKEGLTNAKNWYHADCFVIELKANNNKTTKQ